MAAAPPRPKLVLLDRDGVLNHDRPDFVKNPDELVMIDGAAKAVAALTQAGIKTCVVTNQSCIGRGIITEDMLNRIHAKLFDELAKAGAKLDLVLFAPDAPGPHTPRRKPAPGMVLEALRHFRCLPDEAVMIGDAERDLRAAYGAKVPRILVRTGKGAKTLGAGLPTDLLPVAVFDDLAAAVHHLLDETAENS